MAACWVKGGAADAETAIEAAATLLAGARSPVIAGLNADVAALRTAFRLAGTLGASVDFTGSDAAYADLGSLTRNGIMATTPAEAAGRADVVLVVGARPWDAPGLADLAAGTPSRGRAAGSARSLLVLGGPDGLPHAAFPVEPAGFAVALAHLRAFAKGNLSDDHPYADLARRLAAAQYGVAVYEPGELGEMAVETLQGLVKDLNETTRFFTLGLSGADQSRSVVQVSAWTSGQAPRTGFGRGVPEHDPWRFDAARQAAAGEIDGALWLSPLPGPRPDWLGRVPAVAIVGQGSPEATGELAEIVITVPVPGTGAGGVLWNEGRATLTYRSAGAPGAGPAAAEIVETLAARVAERRTA
ncbi:formyltransferase [Methylobacterium sp. A54F]